VGIIPIDDKAEPLEGRQKLEVGSAKVAENRMEVGTVIEGVALAKNRYVGESVVLSYDVVQVRMSFPSDIGQDRTDRREEGVSFVVNDGLNSGDKISDPGKVFFMAGDDEFDQRHGIIQKDAI
jgi:hypothetical protein